MHLDSWADWMLAAKILTVARYGLWRISAKEVQVVWNENYKISVMESFTLSVVEKKNIESPIYSCIFWVDRDWIGPSLLNFLWRVHGPRRLLERLTKPPRRGVNPAQVVSRLLLFVLYLESSNFFALEIVWWSRAFYEYRAWILCVSIARASGFWQRSKAGTHWIVATPSRRYYMLSFMAATFAEGCCAAILVGYITAASCFFVV